MKQLLPTIAAVVLVGCGTTVNVQTNVWINQAFDPLNNYFICLQ